MKRNIIQTISFAVAALFLTACGSDDNLSPSTTETGTIDKSKYTTFTSVNDGMTRSHYILNHSLNTGADIWWQPGDKLWLYIFDNLRIGSVTSNLTNVSSSAEFYFTYDLLKEDKSSYRYWKTGIFNRPYLANPKGRYKGYPFRSMSNGNYTWGYSDHFPVYMYLIRELK